MSKELMRAEKQDRILTIIIEKGLSLGEVAIIKQSNTYDEYVIAYSLATFRNISTQKSQKECDLLKEMLDNE